MKKFVLLRGGYSGLLYLYDRETYKSMKKNSTLEKKTKHSLVLEFVLDHDDREVLSQMQELVNKDIEVRS